MIKLIASDLDGTLLRNGAMSLEPHVFELIRKLQERGILFVAASGRQYPNVKRLFAPLGKDILYVCENGALTMHHDQKLSSAPIPREQGIALMKDILRFPQCEILLSGQYTSYLMPRQKSYSDFILYTLRNTVTIVDDLFSVEEEFIKISVYVHGNGAAEMAPYFIKQWGNQIHAAIAGVEWVDFTLANKGTAIEMLQAKFGLEKDEMMAFGDNFNDLPMLQAVGHGYAMENADDKVKAACAFCCTRPEDVLEALLRA